MRLLAWFFSIEIEATMQQTILIPCVFKINTKVNNREVNTKILQKFSSYKPRFPEWKMYVLPLQQRPKQMHKQQQYPIFSVLSPIMKSASAMASYISRNPVKPSMWRTHLVQKTSISFVIKKKLLYHFV